MQNTEGPIFCQILPSKTLGGLVILQELCKKNKPQNRLIPYKTGVFQIQNKNFKLKTKIINKKFALKKLIVLNLPYNCKIHFKIY